MCIVNVVSQTYSCQLTCGLRARMYVGGGNNCRTPLPCSIDGVSGDANIAGIWKEHFEQLFNCINDVGDVTFSTEYSSDIAVSAAEVAQAVMRLRHKKACGLDGIYAEHITNCSRRLFTIMAMCLSGLFVHGFLPDGCYLLYLCL